MEIIETEIFTKKIIELISVEEYRSLQTKLVSDPKQGKLIPNAQGLRKLRWKIENKGKSGGIRVIYYFLTENNQIYMLMAYGKSETEDLTKEQLKKLAQYVRKGVI